MKLLIDDLSREVFVLSKTKDVNIKVPNIMTNRNEAATLVKHISYDCKCKFNSATCNSNKKRNNKHINRRGVSREKST